MSPSSARSTELYIVSKEVKLSKERKEMVTMHHYFYILSKHTCEFYWKPETSGLSSISTVIISWYIFIMINIHFSKISSFKILLKFKLVLW